MSIVKPAVFALLKRGLLALATVAAVIPFASIRGAATDIMVTSTVDEVNAADCTLRAAVIAANTQAPAGGCPAGSGDDTIVLTSHATYTLTQVGDVAPAGDPVPGPNGLPSITGRLRIDGNGSIVAGSDAAGAASFRLVRVAATGVVVLEDLAFINGGMGGIGNTGTLQLIRCTVTGNTGGGIDNAGQLAATGVLVSGNSGGGILNYGPFTATEVVVSENTGGGILNGAQITATRVIVSQNAGGGIRSTGDLTAIEATVSDNAGGGGAGIANFGTLRLVNTLVAGNNTADGLYLMGRGGGIFNAGAAVLTATTVRDNTTGGGGSVPVAPGSDGGGIANDGTLLLAASTVSGNRTGSGATGAIFGNNGGNGGGIVNTGTLTILNSTVSGNDTGPGGLGAAGFGSGGGGGGGGIFNDLPGVVTIINSTISGNATGNGGCCGGFDSGGGIANAGTLRLANVTISSNSAGENRGGGVVTFSTGTTEVKNSLIAANNAVNGGPDCCGALTSGGFNLIGDDSDCDLTGDMEGLITGRVPLLGPLQDNGGPTATQALLAGSPAIDAGNPAGCTTPDGVVLSRDQHGAPRVSAGDSRCDIGAYEYGAPVLPVCAGDCDEDGAVTVDELLTSVNIVLGTLPAEACVALATNGTAPPSITDLMQAVNSVLSGCP
jgi:CSLREA domain-containing protein